MSNSDCWDAGLDTYVSQMIISVTKSNVRGLHCHLACSFALIRAGVDGLMLSCTIFHAVEGLQEGLVDNYRAVTITGNRRHGT